MNHFKHFCSKVRTEITPGTNYWLNKSAPYSSAVITVIDLYFVFKHFYHFLYKL